MGVGQYFGHGGKRNRPSGKAAAADGRWLQRQVRGMLPDRNPLRRRTDRVESYLLAGMFVAAAAGTPFAVQAASQAAHASAVSVQQEQLATRHQVKAVLTQRAGASINGYSLSAEVPAKAKWIAPVSHEQRSGEVLARAGSLAGTEVAIWTNGSGDLTSPPFNAGQIAGQADAAGVGAAVGMVVVFLVGAGTVHRVTYRRRLAAWDADWLVTARTWNHQSW